MAKTLSNIRKIVNTYKRVLENNRIHAKKIILYGSYAKGNPKPYSDFDIVIISDDLKRVLPLIRLELLSRLTMFVDAPLEVLGYTSDEFNKAGDTVFGQILTKTGKLVYDE
jgi:predicted nucleotidyltransferase